MSVLASPAAAQAAQSTGNRPSAWARRLDGAIFACIFLIALCAPVSNRASVHAFRAAVLLFAVRILTRGREYKRQPLAAPLLAFLVLTAVSSLFSYQPYFSWGRMRTITLLFLPIVMAQTIAAREENAASLRHLRLLVTALFFGAVVAAAYTAWQYTAGIGVRVLSVPAAGAFSGRVAPGDIIRAVNGRPIRTPQQWRTAVQDAPSGSRLKLLIARNAPLEYSAVEVERDALIASGLAAPNAPLARGRPLRAQGWFHHYIPFSEVLVQLGLLAFGLLAASFAAQRGNRVLLAVVFLATCAALAATVTRTAFTMLLLGCLLVLWLIGRWKLRLAALAVVAAALLASAYWVHQQRGLDLVSHDAGTEYRLLMWKAAADIIRQHPLVGVGLDSTVHMGDKWGLEAYKRFPLHSHYHSTPIQIAAEAGVPALLAWLWLMAGYAALLVRLVRRTGDADWFSRGAALGLAASFVAFLGTALVHYNMGDAEVMVLFWLYMGMAMVLAVTIENVPSQAEPIPSAARSHP